jgi:hypothetical protein
MHAVFLCEAFYRTGTMRFDPARKVARDADVERSVARACEDINGRLLQSSLNDYGPQRLTA